MRPAAANGGWHWRASAPARNSRRHRLCSAALAFGRALPPSTGYPREVRRLLQRRSVLSGALVEQLQVECSPTSDTADPGHGRLRPVAMTFAAEPVTLTLEARS